MEVVDKMEISIHPAEHHPAAREAVRVCIVGMSNPQLLRFGMRVKLSCAEAENSNDPPIEYLRVQLNLARAEWNRRHPKLPLRDSF